MFQVSVGYYANTHLGGLTETHTFSAYGADCNVSFFQNHVVLDKRFSGFSPEPSASILLHMGFGTGAH